MLSSSYVTTGGVYASTFSFCSLLLNLPFHPFAVPFCPLYTPLHLLSSPSSSSYPLTRYLAFPHYSLSPSHIFSTYPYPPSTLYPLLSQILSLPTPIVKSCPVVTCLLTPPLPFLYPSLPPLPPPLF